VRVQPLHTLADYVPWLRSADDSFRLRILLHDFGLLWQDTPPSSQRAVVDHEPPPIEPRWDAFLAALVEHLCYHAKIDPPSWVFEPYRYLDHFWYPANDLPTLRVEAVVHSPAAFEVHGVLLSARELVVV
jgi:hypothetical protein